jgi:NADPH:quinone reductase-like Zn-dependent oxidoreductase
LVLGRDFSGAVAALGAGVDDLKNGDAVFGVLEVGREGAYAEKLAVRRRAVRQQSSPNAARPSRAWRAHLLMAWSG